MNFRITISLLLMLFLIGCGQLSETPEPEFWIWMHADTEKNITEWDDAFEQLNDAGFKGVLMGANIDVLKLAIPVAKKNGLEVHAWMWTMNRGDADSSWLSVNQLGKSLAEQEAYVAYYKFMCPALPEVKTFLKSKIDKLAAIDGLDGIHMDYIRYVDAILPIGLQANYNLNQDQIFPEFDYGYHPYMVNQYIEKTGINPYDLKNPATNPEWLKFRLNQLNETVWELRDHIYKHGLKASAAVFPTPQMAHEMVRQEWDTWALDNYFPMVYHNFYNQNFEWITEVMKENKSAISSPSKVICGLYASALKDKTDLKIAIQAALDGGADGIAIFEYRAINQNMMDQIKQIHFESVN